MIKKTTSIRLDEKLWIEFRWYCLSRNITASNKIEEMIREMLKNEKEET